MKHARFILAMLLVPLAASRAATLPDDIRLQPLKDLKGYFPFTPPESRAEWDTRADYVRRRILVSQGLWPMAGLYAVFLVLAVLGFREWRLSLERAG